MKLKINFQDGQHIIFKVPVIRLQDYGLDQIHRKKLWLFFPFLALQYAADLRSSNHLQKQEALAEYKKMVKYVEIAYNNDEITIDEDVTLLEAIQRTNWHAMKNHQEIMEGVDDMVSQTLELKHKQIAREAAQKTELSMLMEMKIEGIPKQAIIRIAKRQNIPEEEVNRIFDSKE